MKRVVTAFILCLSAALQSYAGINHGLNTIFDPNSFGGNWTCFRSLASGTCDGATTHYFNAACDGTTDDTTARLAWISYGIANPSPSPKLFIPPGSKCRFVTNGCLITTCNPGDPAIPSSIIWAYGAYATEEIAFGGLDWYADGAHSAYFQTANIGDTNLILKTAADASIFAVGNWVKVTGLTLQKGGFPPNFQFFESHKITAITGTATKVITLDGPLINRYDSTWPQIDDVLTGGPAQIYLMQPSWDAELDVYGLSTLALNQQVVVRGRKTILHNVNFASGVAPSSNHEVRFLGGEVSSPEIDKDIDFMEMTGVTGSTLTFQSPSPYNVVVSVSNFRVSINGVAKNATLSSSSTPFLRVGTTGFGYGGSLNVNSTTFATADSARGDNIAISALSWDGAGTLSIPNNSGVINNAWALFVPGATYYIGDNAGVDDSSPHTTFHVTSVTSNGTTTFYGTDIPAGAFPTPTCGGFMCSTIVIYSLTGLTQTNTGSSPSLAGFVAPP